MSVMIKLNWSRYLDKLVGWLRRPNTAPNDRLPAWVDSYSTHREYLAEVFKIKGEIATVLEFGTGNYSTGLMIENSEKCISIEMQSAVWYEKMVGRFSGSKNWERHLSIGPMKWMGIDLPDTIDLGFVDGHGESRPECINYLMAKGCPIIICHDTEEPGYGWDRVKHDKAYRQIVFKKHDNWTTLWTTDVTVHDHFVREKIR